MSPFSDQTIASDSAVRILKSRGGRKYLAQLGVIITLVSGCAVAPIQEMSDGRQAISAARAVIELSESGTDDTLIRAEALMQKAEKSLRERKYNIARRLADQAKQLAIEARMQAVQKSEDDTKD